NTVKSFRSRVTNLEAISLCNTMVVAEVNDLYEVDLQYNNVGVLDDDDPENHLNAARAIAKLFLVGNCDGYTSNLVNVNLAGNALNDECARILCTALAENKTIRVLNLRRNPLGNEGGLHVARMLEINSNLADLDIGDTDIGHGSLIAISGALRHNTALARINLDNPVLKTLEEEALQHVGKMLQVNATLTHVSLCKHQITDVGAQVLAERLLDNHTLTCLHLRANRIGGFGSEALAALLLSDSRIVELDLTANRIGNDGAQAFETVLEVSTRLQVLCLGHNSIEDAGLARLANGVARNSHSALTKLIVWGNDFGDVAPEQFHNLLQHNVALHTDVQTYVVDGKVHVAQKDSTK
ncbi:hypothetical protein DYB32_001557, partial [Aphanomyces invadans]